MKNRGTETRKDTSQEDEEQKKQTFLEVDGAMRKRMVELGLRIAEEEEEGRGGRRR